MRKCLFEDMIDDYLFNRLEPAQKDAFEEHYFNCRRCFELMKERDEMVTVIKARGHEIFRDVYAPEETRRSWTETVSAFLTPRQWALVAATAALVLVVVLGVIPNLSKKAPEFFINDDLVRGSSIQLISPVIDGLKQIPSEFRWQSLGENITYRLFVYTEEKRLWSAETTETHMALPEHIKHLMVPGKPYYWQVKAFSPKGALIAVSSRVQFSFGNGE
ncbi:MAG: zf-HC2 domain-containing protein [Candidatus Aminicenantales bacterium]